MHSSTLIDLKPTISEAGREILHGLMRTPKAIASKYLYDQHGSSLFELITALPEYYLTRTEIQILREFSGDIASQVGAGRLLIEFGSGSSAKTRLLLESLRPVGYVPVEISRQRLAASVASLHEEFEWLNIIPISADYSRPLRLPSAATTGSRTVFFPGSSIGNFEPREAVAFLWAARSVAGADGQLLIGIDLKKNSATIEHAYDDAQGVTAAFTLNALQHLNNIVGASFDLNAFRHHARYNDQAARVEIHLVSLKDQTVHVSGRRIPLRDGEMIHIENCYKYEPKEFDALAARGGFTRRAAWFDPQRWFGVLLYTSASPDISR
jgi:dimethylhistidine N-methyltransferase